MNTDEEHSSNGALTNKIARLFGLEPKAPENIKQLQNLISLSEKRPFLPTDVAGMINGVLQVSEMRVGDIMIPRSQMVVLDLKDPRQIHLNTIVGTAHSRFPVIDGAMDKVVGVLLAKDLLHWCVNAEEQSDNFNIDEVLRAPIFVPESKRLNIMLKEFRDNRNHLAIVVDEYGGTTGMVTIEDVLEQIVGDITDEHDVEGQNNILRHSKTRYTVKARTSMDDFNQYFGSDLAFGEINTIGGFVINSLGHLPKRNETLEFDKFEFKILRASKRRILLLQVNIKNWN